MNKSYGFLFTLLMPFALSNCKKNCPTVPEEPSCKVELTKGLLVYFPFNGNTNDASGNGNNATAMNGAYLTTDFIGRANMAAGFDGINDYMIVPGSEKLNSDSVTVSLQVIANNTNRGIALVNHDRFEDASSVIWGTGQELATDNHWSFTVLPGTDDCSTIYPYTPSLDIPASAPIVPGRWYSIIATFGNGTGNIYIDGILKGSKTTTWTKLKRCANADLLIGAFWKNGIVSVDGKIDEVRVYSRVLTDCEIAKLSESFK